MEGSAKGLMTDAGVFGKLGAEGIHRHYYFRIVVFLFITRKLNKMDDIFLLGDIFCRLILVSSQQNWK